MAAKMTVDERAKLLAGLESYETDYTTWIRMNPGLIPLDVVHRKALIATHMLEAIEDARVQWEQELASKMNGPVNPNQ